MTVDQLRPLPGGRRGRPVRLICFGLSAEEHEQLDALARAEERDAVAQARWIVREAIRTAALSEERVS
jgi:hypothetical protein